MIASVLARAVAGRVETRAAFVAEILAAGSAYHTDDLCQVNDRGRFSCA
jgi:hypothetical protein